MLIGSLSKQKRSTEDIHTISNHLKTMPKMVDLITLSKVDENELMTHISLQMKLETLTKNRILFRIGIYLLI